MLETGRQLQQVLGIFERVQSDSVQRNTITYGAAISACGKGELQAFGFFQAMAAGLGAL